MAYVHDIHPHSRFRAESDEPFYDTGPERRVADYLANRESASALEIADHLNIPPDQALSILWTMLDEGTVELA